MAEYFKEWICVHPGRSGKWWIVAASKTYKTREEAQSEADKYANVAAVPLRLFESMVESQRRMTEAEHILNNIRVDAQNWETERKKLWVI